MVEIMAGLFVKKIEDLTQDIFVPFAKRIQRFHQGSIFDELDQLLSEHLRWKNYVGRATFHCAVWHSVKSCRQWILNNCNAALTFYGFQAFCPIRSRSR